MNTKRVLVEKLAVVGMFMLVIAVFSAAQRDTQKIIETQTRTTREWDQKPAQTALVPDAQTHIQLPADN